MAPRAKRTTIPKTAEQRRLEGGTSGSGAVSKRRVPKTVVLAPRVTTHTRPAAPKDLPPEAMQVWDEAIEALIDANAAQTIDMPALRLMCVHFAIAWRSWSVLCEQGYFGRGSTGQMQAHPALAIFRENSKAFQSYANEYGLTTLARTRLGMLELSRRSMEDDLNNGLGRNPRHTQPAPAAEA